MMREVMTPEQVADYLQLTTDTVYRLIRQHKLAATRIGRHYRVPKEDLDSFLLRQSTRQEVRDALFTRVLVIAERQPKLSSDAVLEALEQEEQEAPPATAR
jgi:excisionase family DNA binding protein